MTKTGAAPKHSAALGSYAPIRTGVPMSVTEYSSSQRSAGISKSEILDILAGCDSAGLPEAIDDDTLLVIDSYAAIWIQHLLEERHGLVVKLSGETADINSVSGLQALVNRKLDVGSA